MEHTVLLQDLEKVVGSIVDMAREMVVYRYSEASLVVSGSHRQVAETQDGSEMERVTLRET